MMQAQLLRQEHRIKGGNQQCSHAPVESPQARGIGQNTRHLLTQKGPGCDAGYVERAKDSRHQQQRAKAGARGVNGHSRDGHGPRFGIDPLKGASLQEGHGHAGGVGLGLRGGGGDLEGQIQHVQHGRDFQDSCAQSGCSCRTLAPARGRPESTISTKPIPTPSMCGSVAGKAEIGPRRHQHQVVGPRRDGAGKSKSRRGRSGVHKASTQCLTQVLRAIEIANCYEVAVAICATNEQSLTT